MGIRQNKIVARQYSQGVLSLDRSQDKLCSRPQQKDDRLAIWHFIISKIIFPRRLRRKFNDAFYNSQSPHDVLITHSCLIFRWEVLNSESGHHHSFVVSKIVLIHFCRIVSFMGHLGTSFDINTALHPSPANVDWQIKGWSVSANWCFPTQLHFRFNASLSIWWQYFRPELPPPDRRLTQAGRQLPHVSRGLWQVSQGQQNVRTSLKIYFLEATRGVWWTRAAMRDATPASAETRNAPSASRWGVSFRFNLHLQFR